MRRWAIWALNVALFVTGCFLAARIAVAIVAEVALPLRTEAPAAAVGRLADARSWADSKVIVERNLFGAKVAGLQGEAPAVTEKSVETKLPLQLLGTVAVDD